MRSCILSILVCLFYINNLQSQNLVDIYDILNDKIPQELLSIKNDVDVNVLGEKEGVQLIQFKKYGDEEYFWFAFDGTYENSSFLLSQEYPDGLFFSQDDGLYIYNEVEGQFRSYELLKLQIGSREPINLGVFNIGTKFFDIAHTTADKIVLTTTDNFDSFYGSSIFVFSIGDGDPVQVFRNDMRYDDEKYYYPYKDSLIYFVNVNNHDDKISLKSLNYLNGEFIDEITLFDNVSGLSSNTGGIWVDASYENEETLILGLEVEHLEQEKLYYYHIDLKVGSVVEITSADIYGFNLEPIANSKIIPFKDKFILNPDNENFIYYDPVENKTTPFTFPTKGSIKFNREITQIFSDEENLFITKRTPPSYGWRDYFYFDSENPSFKILETKYDASNGYGLRGNSIIEYEGDYLFGYMENVHNSGILRVSKDLSSKEFYEISRDSIYFSGLYNFDNQFYARYYDELKDQTVYAIFDISGLFTTSSIEDDFILDTEIYPNPAKAFINLRKDHVGGKGTLTNLAGDIIKSWTLKDSKLYVGDLMNGHYFLKIKTDNKTYVSRILKIDQ